MYVCMYVCEVCYGMYVSMYLCIYVSMYVFFFVFLNQSHQPWVPSMCISSDYVSPHEPRFFFGGDCSISSLCLLRNCFIHCLASAGAFSLASAAAFSFFWRLHSISLFAWRPPSTLLFFWSLLPVLQHFESKSTFAIRFLPFLNVMPGPFLDSICDAFWHLLGECDVDLAHKFA